MIRTSMTMTMTEELTLLTRQLQALDSSQRRDVAARLRGLTSAVNGQDGDGFTTSHVLKLLIACLEPPRTVAPRSHRQPPQSVHQPHDLDIGDELEELRITTPERVPDAPSRALSPATAAWDDEPVSESAVLDLDGD
jgi:hypothetical protein